MSEERIQQLRAQLAQEQFPVEPALELLEIAQANDDKALEVDARMWIVEACCYFGGSQSHLLSNFVWLTRRYDEGDPLVTQHRHALLWMHKSVVATVLNDPRISLDRAWQVLEQTRIRYAMAGWDGKPMSRLELRVRSHTDPWESLTGLFERWRHQPRNEMSDCEACETSSEVEFLAECGRDEEAAALAAMSLQREESCSSHPEEVLAAGLESLLRTGRADVALPMVLQAHRRRGHAAREGRLAPQFSLARLWARCGNLAWALDALNSGLSQLPHPLDHSLRRSAIRAGAVVCRRFVEAGLGDTAMSVLQHTGTAAQLASPLREEALELARELDRRNGNTLQSDSELRALDAEELPRLPLDHVEPRLVPDREDAVDPAGLSLAEIRRHWNLMSTPRQQFPQLGAEWAAREHRGEIDLGDADDRRITLEMVRAMLLHPEPDRSWLDRLEQRLDPAGSLVVQILRARAEDRAEDCSTLLAELSPVASRDDLLLVLRDPSANGDAEARATVRQLLPRVNERDSLRHRLVWLMMRRGELQEEDPEGWAPRFVPLVLTTFSGTDPLEAQLDSLVALVQSSSSLSAEEQRAVAQRLREFLDADHADPAHEAHLWVMLGLVEPEEAEEHWCRGLEAANRAGQISSAMGMAHRVVYFHLEQNRIAEAVNVAEAWISQLPEHPDDGKDVPLSLGFDLLVAGAHAQKAAQDLPRAAALWRRADAWFDDDASPADRLPLWWMIVGASDDSPELVEWCNRILAIDLDTVPLAGTPMVPRAALVKASTLLALGSGEVEAALHEASQVAERMQARVNREAEDAPAGWDPREHHCGVEDIRFRLLCEQERWPEALDSVDALIAETVVPEWTPRHRLLRCTLLADAGRLDEAFEANWQASEEYGTDTDWVDLVEQVTLHVCHVLHSAGREAQAQQLWEHTQAVFDRLGD